jgi:dihydroorotase
VTAALVLRGGVVVDQTGRRRADVAVAGGTVVAVAPQVEPPLGAVVLDARGCVIGPGLVDLHTHLREPGGEEAERVETGARAAARGGYTAVVAMPNTDPPIDTAAVARQVLDLGRVSAVEVAVAGAVTVGRKGERLAPMAELAGMGVRLFTDDGSPVGDARIMRRAMEYAAGLEVTVADHCEEPSLSAGGQMHEGEWSARLGLPGSPALAEELMVGRDLALARLTGARLHLLHLSTAGSLALVHGAKADGVAVTAEATPHHLSLTDAEVAGFDPVFKVNPPLRSAADVAALQSALLDGTLDAVATDHAPHAAEAKEAPFDEAPPGMLGLETALAVVLTALGSGARASSPRNGGRSRRSRSGPEDPGHEDRGPEDRGTGRSAVVDPVIDRLLGLMSWQPARIAGLARQGGPVAPGAAANLMVLDPSATWVVEPSRLASRSRNTPFAGRRLTGRIRHTVSRGVAVVIDGEPTQ